MITVPHIEPNPPAQSSSKDGRQARAGSRATVQPVEPTGRALATQRDALFFRSESILLLSTAAQAPYLAQQIGQLWPSTAEATHKSAHDAYQKSALDAAFADGHQASVLV